MDFLTVLSQVDPVIRASMDIDLAGSVIIFDEGHNIEDTARWVCSKLHHTRAQTPTLMS
jgi:Rad3-related DNA helicase